MKPEDLLIRCMAWQDGALWVAACIDFTLAAQGGSLDEAKARLHRQILSYVQEAMTVDAAHAAELLARKAPLRDQMRYSFWKAVSRRPRLRATTGRLMRAVGLAIRKKFSYIEPLPVALVA